MSMINSKENDFARLEAENKRLKRLMKRMYQGLLGVQVDDEASNKSGHQEYLPLFISSILAKNRPFEERINLVLEELGRFTDVSRIYIFENHNDHQRLSNTYEWCNEGVRKEKDQLQNLAYSSFPEWKRLLTEDGIIKASNVLEDLPKEVHETLGNQNIEAIMVIPLMVNDDFHGFIGLDECSFNREWFQHETDLLKMTARLIGNAYERELNQARLLDHNSNQQILLDLSHIFTSDQSFDEQVNSAIKKLADHFNIQHIFLYENENNNANCHLKFQYPQNSMSPLNGYGTVLNYETDIAGWTKAFNDKGFINAELSDTNSRYFSGSNTTTSGSILALPIRSKNKFCGFIGFNSQEKNKTWDTAQETVFSTFADMLASAYEQKSTYLKLENSHTEILNINRVLEKKESFLQNLLRSAPIGIMLVRNRTIEYLNSVILSQSGYTEDELIGCAVSKLYYEDEENIADVEKFYQDIDRNGIASYEAIMRYKDGQPVNLRILGTQAPDDKEGMCYMLIGEDISEIRLTEKNLLESEERNRKIIETTVDGIFILNQNNDLFYANNSGLKMLGYTHEELHALELKNLFPEEKYLTSFKHARDRLSNNNDFTGDVQLLHKSGSIVHSEIFATSIQLNGEMHFYFSLHNISKRKRHEGALKQSEKKFRALTENSPDHILRIDRQKQISFCNAAFLSDFDIQESDCIGKELSHLNQLPGIVVEGLNNAIDDVLISSVITPVELEYEHSGQTFAFDWTITPETDNQQLTSLLLVGRNFTLRKRAEKELVVAKERAVSADRLKSAFLANMSHEIRTPLNAIVGFTNLLKEEQISDQEKGEYVQIINNSSESLMELINDIVDLAKIESGELVIDTELANPNSLLQEIYMLFDKKMAIDSKKHLRFYLNIPDNTSDLLINVDLMRLNQVFINLIGNAFKFTSKGFIEFGYTREDENVRFFVRDTGIGITQEKQDIIFDPFRQEDETTAKTYGGTGLGLSISKHLISAMGGELKINSEKNKGSEFYFSMSLNTMQQTIVPEPIVTIETEPVKIKPNNNFSWSDKMVLLVDATSSAQLQMRKYLEHTKITLISARTPNSARELLLKRNDIDLVLIDINMPGLNSTEFIQQVRQQGINVPFIAQSSGMNESQKLELISYGFDSAINKPVEKDELLEKFQAGILGMYNSKLN
ncbi:PAS domain S-box protein [Carboxylicivirga sp. N1Y90]|uniref:PAS domain S-box protein n=1 Tax=Carboxylicivirga fragile TaxID=3417571 RepID=UPI003D356147|nr:PAS domain S-box protein [Marinilabiliaceae bacterium N1Y90]